MNSTVELKELIKIIKTETGKTMQEISAELNRSERTLSQMISSKRVSAKLVELIKLKYKAVLTKSTLINPDYLLNDPGHGGDGTKELPLAEKYKLLLEENNRLLKEKTGADGTPANKVTAYAASQNLSTLTATLATIQELIIDFDVLVQAKSAQERAAIFHKKLSDHLRKQKSNFSGVHKTSSE